MENRKPIISWIGLAGITVCAVQLTTASAPLIPFNVAMFLISVSLGLLGVGFVRFRRTLPESAAGSRLHVIANSLPSEEIITE